MGRRFYRTDEIRKILEEKMKKIIDEYDNLIMKE